MPAKPSGVPEATTARARPSHSRGTIRIAAVEMTLVCTMPSATPHTTPYVSHTCQASRVAATRLKATDSATRPPPSETIGETRSASAPDKGASRPMHTCSSAASDAEPERLQLHSRSQRRYRATTRAP
eukprot:4839676-Prymnesium_polylepis.1